MITYTEHGIHTTTTLCRGDKYFDEFGKHRAGWFLFPNRSIKRNCLFRLFFQQFSITATTAAAATTTAIITAAGADLANVRQQCQVVTRGRALTNRPGRGGPGGEGSDCLYGVIYIILDYGGARPGKIGSLRFTRLKAAAGKGTTHTHTPLGLPYIYGGGFIVDWTDKVPSAMSTFVRVSTPYSNCERYVLTECMCRLCKNRCSKEKSIERGKKSFLWVFFLLRSLHDDEKYSRSARLTKTAADRTVLSGLARTKRRVKCARPTASQTPFSHNPF